MFKRFTICICTLALLLGLAACGETPNTTNPPPAPVKYTVTVVCGEDFTEEETAAVFESATAYIYSTDNTEVEHKSLTVSPSGTAYADFNLTPAEYVVKLQNVPSEYFTDDPIRVTAANKIARFTVTKEPVIMERTTYTVTVLDPSGAPVAGVVVTFCVAEGQGDASYTCSTAPATDATGTTSILLLNYTYEIHIEENQWPAGCTFDDTAYRVSPDTPTAEVHFTAA